MLARAPWRTHAVCQAQACASGGVLQGQTAWLEAMHAFTMTGTPRRPFHGITQLQALDALHLDTCTGLEQAGDVISQLTKLTALEVSASGPSMTAGLSCISWANGRCLLLCCMHWLPTGALCHPVDDTHLTLPQSPHSTASTTASHDHLLPWPQLSNVTTGDSAPWEALRQLRNLRELMLHNFRDAQQGLRPGRNSTPRSPGYLWRDMEQLRLLSVTGTMHRDLLERSSVAYAVGGRSMYACGEP